MWIYYLAVFLWFATVGHAGDSPTIRGVTISAQTWGKEWQTPEMAAALDELKALGANSIAIHPYARIQADGSLRFDTEPDPSYVTKPLDWAHERNLNVMLVPHIAYWGSPFLWRGEIDFAKPSQWNRFFGDYERWITGMARIAEKHHAGILCIGLEYSHGQKYEQRWRQIIHSIREVYHGKLTYGSNWGETDEVAFWDALDYIGVLAYFPLSDAANPTPEQLRAGWRPWMRKLEAASQKFGKPVLFTEIGYDESALCAAKPWSFNDKSGPNAVALQARCIEQALKLPSEYPFLAGMFFWKWFPNLPCPEVETFDLRRQGIKRLLAKYWVETPHTEHN
jgi:hypothetical protein